MSSSTPQNPQAMSERHSSGASTAKNETITVSEKFVDPEKATSKTEPTDPNLVDWDANDPENPLNWSRAKTWSNLGVISFFRFLSPLCSSMVAPVANLVLADFGVNNQIVGSLITSIYILGFTIGPLLLAPLSEIYGRLPVYHVNNVLFVIWNVAAALSPNVTSVLVFRFLVGLAGSCPVTIGNGSVADCIRKEKRGAAMAIFTIGPLVGPCAGPIAGGFLGQAAGWRWIFWTLAITSGVLAIVSFIVQRETFAPVILERRTRALRLETNNPKLYHPYSDSIGRTKKQIFTRAISRPMKMLCMSPVVVITSLYVGLVYGYMYLLFTSFSTLFSEVYGFSQGIIGLTYLGIGIGCVIGLIAVGTLSDRMTIQYSKQKSEWKPEYRLAPLLPGSLAMPIGLFWYGWSAQAKIHWIMPIIGSGWVGLATLAVYMPIQTYVIDAFPVYGASASAAATLFRSFMGAFLPMAGPPMYRAMGQGWGNSLLAFIALTLTPVAWILFKHGEKIRKSYPVDFS